MTEPITRDEQHWVNKRCDDGRCPRCRGERFWMFAGTE